MTPWLLGLLLLLAPGPLGRSSDSADAIVKAAAARPQPEAVKQRTTMTLLDTKGRTRIKEFTVYRRKTKDGWETRMEFVEPKEVAGTVLLVLDRPKGTEQFLYLPRMRRTRRLSGKARSGAFMGSDFSYEDLQTRETSSATYELVGTSQVGERECDVVEGIPKKDTRSAYTKLETCFDRETRIPLRVRFFKGEQVLKTLVVDPSSIESDIPRRMTMTAADGHQTRLEILDLDISPTLLNRLFDPAHLGR